MEDGIATMRDGGERIPGCADVSRLINTFQLVCSFICIIFLNYVSIYPVPNPNIFKKY